jgi:hypothetical protein
MIGWVCSSIEGEKKFMRKRNLIKCGLLRNWETDGLSYKPISGKRDCVDKRCREAGQVYNLLPVLILTALNLR